MEEKDLKELWGLCVKSMQSPGDAYLREQLVRGCRGAGVHMLHQYRLDRPTQSRMVYRKFDGTGSLSIHRTMTGFLTHGRSLDQVVTRTRVQLARSLSLALLYDDSSSMSAWWRNKYFPYRLLTEETAPQTSAKIGCLALLEAFGAEADIVVFVFGSQVTGPLMKRENIYQELVKRNGSGGTRLDLALQKLMDLRWHESPGMKVMVVLTDGVPETGRREEAEDIRIQRSVINNIKRVLDSGVQVLYVPIFTDDKLSRFRTGEYDARGFVERIQRMGATTAEVTQEADLLKTLFQGVRRMLQELEEKEAKKILTV
ncbi:MAG: VWA domain-containing protein [Euryarchaeota archaeon]|nr:VWA domain-containing protein [Euryarchaeota archaeon]